jgi:hypothetical protein
MDRWTMLHGQLDSHWTKEEATAKRTIHTNIKNDVRMDERRQTKGKNGQGRNMPMLWYTAVEDQLHLYQCKNEKMTTAFYERLDNSPKTMRDAEIPAKVFVSISNIICKASKRQKINKFKVQCEATLETAEQEQMNLGLEQTLFRSNRRNTNTF